MQLWKLEPSGQIFVSSCKKPLQSLRIRILFQLPQTSLISRENTFKEFCYNCVVGVLVSVVRSVKLHNHDQMYWKFYSRKKRKPVTFGLENIPFPINDHHNMSSCFSMTLATQHRINFFYDSKLKRKKNFWAQFLVRFFFSVLFCSLSLVSVLKMSLKLVNNKV